eukprot:jgi/Mesen1/5154/ME000255S04122
MDVDLLDKIGTFCAITGATEQQAAASLQTDEDDDDENDDDYGGDDDEEGPLRAAGGPAYRRALAQPPPGSGRGPASRVPWHVAMAAPPAAPRVTHPREVKEIPVAWAEEPRREGRGGFAAPRVEELPADVELAAPAQTGQVSFPDNDDDNNSNQEMELDPVGTGYGALGVAGLGGEAGGNPALEGGLGEEEGAPPEGHDE